MRKPASDRKPASYKAAHDRFGVALRVYLAAVQQRTGEKLDWREVVNEVAGQIGITEGWPKDPTEKMLVAATKALESGTQAVHDADGPPADDGPEPYDAGDGADDLDTGDEPL